MLFCPPVTLLVTTLLNTGDMPGVCLGLNFAKHPEMLSQACQHHIHVGTRLLLPVDAMGCYFITGLSLKTVFNQGAYFTNMFIIGAGSSTN